MKTAMSKTQVQQKINEFFQKESFSQDEMRKIKKLAMKYRIRLGKLKTKFCKNCFSQLKGKIRISKKHKTIECEICKTKNKFKISSI